jgi:uncharacterized protein YecE (DUF72 family)
MEWVGGFYPSGTTSSKMLRHYARIFPVVELNFTYYRVPTAEALLRLADQAPPGFQFVVKLHQSLTHELVMTSVGPFRTALDALADRNRLLGVLAQFPQRFHYNRGGLEWLDRLDREFRRHRLSVEFRHVSWARPEVTEWLRVHDMDIVSVDVPPAAGLFPTGLVLSSRTAYIRFHSRNEAAWYQSDAERYDYLYSDAEMGEWVAALDRRRREMDRAIVFFNNCRRSQAAQNARRFVELITSQGHGMNVVEPRTPRPGPQRDLFDGLS